MAFLGLSVGAGASAGVFDRLSGMGWLDIGVGYFWISFDVEVGVEMAARSGCGSSVVV